VTVSVPTIVGWNEQWYEKLPAVFIVIGLLVAPGAMVPVSNADPSAVAVWGIVSPLCHATVCPTFSVAGFGENELLPFMPLMVIVIAPVAGLEVGGSVAGDGDVGME
jgi:hypothetical protein